MKYSIRILSLFLLIAFALQSAGCTRLFGPSDQDVIKAINDSGMLKNGGFTVTEPIVVLEKGKQRQDGSWPVKIKVTLTLTMSNGQTSARVTTPIITMRKSKNTAGETVWIATAGGSMP